MQSPGASRGPIHAGVALATRKFVFHLKRASDYHDAMGLKSEYAWLAEPLLRIEGAMPRRFFGCDSIYARGKLLLVLSDGEEPWNGAFFPVERVNHEAVLARWPDLREHPILAKWLYLRASDERFEMLARGLVREIERGNPLFGVVPNPKKSRKKRAAKNPEGSKDASGPQTPRSLIPPHLR